MFCFSLIVEMGSLECVILGCTLLLFLYFQGCFGNGSVRDSVVAHGSTGDVVPSLVILRTLVPGEQNCLACRWRACDADMDGGPVHEGIAIGQCEDPEEPQGDLVAKNVGDSAWILNQYYNGLGEEEADNISNYSAN